MTIKNPTPAGKAALALIDSTHSFIRNDGSVSGVKGITRQVVAPLLRDGFVEPNGASRATFNGRSARRLRLTATGRTFLVG